MTAFAFIHCLHLFLPVQQKHCCIAAAATILSDAQFNKINQKSLLAKPWLDKGSRKKFRSRLKLIIQQEAGQLFVQAWLQRDDHYFETKTVDGKKAGICIIEGVQNSKVQNRLKCTEEIWDDLDGLNFFGKPCMNGIVLVGGYKCTSLCY